jgi:hypothetical protein
MLRCPYCCDLRKRVWDIGGLMRRLEPVSSGLQESVTEDPETAALFDWEFHEKWTAGS